MNTWKVILATLIIFGTGVVTGGLLVSYSLHTNIGLSAPPAPAPVPQAGGTNPWMQRARELLRRMDRDLDLTPEQHQHIEKLITDSAERTRNLWAPIAPLMSKEMQKLHRDIRDQLDTGQRKKFELMTRPRVNQQNRRPGPNQPPGLQTNAAPVNP